MNGGGERRSSVWMRWCYSLGGGWVGYLVGGAFDVDLDDHGDAVHLAPIAFHEFAVGELLLLFWGKEGE